MGFEQALIKVEKEKEFGELKGAIEEGLPPGKVKGFLRRLRRGRIRIRDFEAVLYATRWKLGGRI